MRRNGAGVRYSFRIAWALALIAGVAAAATSEGTQQAHGDENHELEGYASWYAGKFQGRTTASGEVFDTNELTAAHKTLPFGTVVVVTNVRNELEVAVRINDRGPFVEGRVIDLSRAAAEAIDMTADGIAPVSLTIVSVPPKPLRRIQVASFARADNADRKVTRLRSNGLDAEVEQAGSLYRVIIAGVPAGDVEEIVARLARLGYPDVLVRVE